MKRIAFLQFGGRGDMLMATAILAAVRDKHPDDHITWVCLDCYRDIIENHVLIDSVIAWPQRPGQTRVQQEQGLWADMKEYARVNFDVVYSPQHYPDHYPRRQHGLHLIDHMYIHAGIEKPANPSLTFYASDADKARAAKLLEKVNRPFVSANTTAICQGKIWPASNWGHLYRLLDHHKYDLVVGDEKIAGPWCCTTTFGAWREIIAKADCYIGLDSGGTWLAATTSTPQIVLRSETNDNPYWFTGFRPSGVKQNAIEFTRTPTPEEVVEQLVMQHAGYDEFGVVIP